MPRPSHSVPGGPPRTSFLSDLVTSLLTQVCVVAGNLVALRLAAHMMGPDGVGQFALVRRVVVFLAPLALLGLGVGLPRTLARVASDNDRRASVILGGWLIGLPALALVVGLFVVLPGHAARLLFGGPNTELLMPLALLLAANQGFVLTYGALRGDLQIRRANLVQILLVAVLPPLCVACVGHQGARATLLWTGVVTTAAAALIGAALLRSVWHARRAHALRAGTHELLTYGLPRMPGDLALTSLYAIGPIMAAHALDLHAAGALAIGMNLVTVLSAAFGPLGLVLLPRLSRKLATAGEPGFAGRLPLLIGVATYGACFMVGVSMVFGNGWIELILGPALRFETTALALLVVAAGSNVIFVLLRSVLDATSSRPRNAIHAFASLCALFVLWSVSRQFAPTHPLLCICFAIAGSFAILAGLTLLALAREFRLWPGVRGTLRWGCVQGVTLAAGRLLGCEPSQGLPRFVGAQIVVAAVWLVGMRVVGVQWPVDFWRFLRPKRPAIAVADAAVAGPPETGAGVKDAPATADPTTSAAPQPRAAEVEAVSPRR